MLMWPQIETQAWLRDDGINCRYATALQERCNVILGKEDLSANAVMGDLACGGKLVEFGGADPDLSGCFGNGHRFTCRLRKTFLLITFEKKPDQPFIELRWNDQAVPGIFVSVLFGIGKVNGLFGFAW